MPRSNKKVLNPNDFLLPFKCRFPREVDININATHYHYEPNVDYFLTLSEFEGLRNSHYIELLKPYLH